VAWQLRPCHYMEGFIGTVLLPLSITTFGPRRLAHWQKTTSAPFQEFNPHLQYGWNPWNYEVLQAKFVSSPVLNVTDVEFSTSPWMITYLRLSTSIYFHSITGITLSRGPCFQSYRQVNQLAQCTREMSLTRRKSWRPSATDGSNSSLSAR
jgi:hypothetical protein